MKRSARIASFYLAVVWILLSIAHIPLLYFGDDSVGLYDLTTVILGSLILTKWSIGKSEFHFSRETLIIVLMYLCFLLASLISILINQVGIYSILLLLKSIQYFVAFIITFQLFWCLSSQERYLLLFLVPLFTAITGLWRFMIDSQVRLGLVFKSGVSSNPAGFVLFLGLTLIVINFHKIPIKNTLKACLTGLIAFAGVLTFSRTNSMIFIVFMIAYYIWIGRLKPLITIAVALIGLYCLVYGFDLFYWARITRNPLSYFLADNMLNDPSFKLRYGITWFRGAETWAQSWIKIFFGNGLGKYGPHESLYFALLFNGGALSFVSYLVTLFSLLLTRSKNILVIIIFCMINGLATETTLNSFRTVQILVCFLALIYSENKSEITLHTK